MLAIKLETIRDLLDIKGMTKEMLRAVLTHPNMAIVDRGAELTSSISYFLGLEIGSVGALFDNYPENFNKIMKTIEQRLLKEGWVKELTNEK